MSQVDGQQKYAIRITHKDFKVNLYILNCILFITCQ